VREARSHLLRLSGPLGVLLGLAALGAIAISALGYRQGWWPLAQALTFAQYAVYAAILAFLVSAVAMVWSAARRRYGQLLLATVGLLAALVPTAIGAQWEYTGRTTPRVNDISTDTMNPPPFRDTPTRAAYPAQNAELQHATYPDLAPLELPLGPRDAFAAALALVRARGWEILAADQDQRHIEAVASTFLYGFKDEVAIRVAPSATGSRVDVRSRSRLGRNDRGANAKRIRAFLADLAKAGAGHG
jgi:uncharacterized protein (DUF1499 family)